jgi:polyketide cyclase/dehydrase/lipid transport protein
MRSMNPIYSCKQRLSRVFHDGSTLAARAAGTLASSMRTAANSTWNARLEMRAPAEHVLDVLTDPEACSRWSPIDFEVEELDGDRLVAGSRARVTGRLAGARVCFDVEVFEDGPERLALRASGPVVLDVDYRFAPVSGQSTEVTASVSVGRGRGVLGRMLEPATRGLLAGGALQSAVTRIARTVEKSREAPAFAS